ncbi:MAG: hypothetical protein QM692_22295 [Thermomicrobiales bacterium]
MNDVVTWAVDIGSVKRNRFGWCRKDRNSLRSGESIVDLVEGVSQDLNERRQVALGFECPLFVPVTADPQNLTSARIGEGSRSWSAGAGCGALATGLPETVWILERVRHTVAVPVAATLNWEAFHERQANLFLWEAFVTGAAKGEAHTHDAEIAALKFWESLDDIVGANAVVAEAPFSLIGAALLRSGLSADLRLLFEPCIVIRA